MPGGHGRSNSIFFQNENKQILWDLLSASRYFDGLGKEDFDRTLRTFEDTMLEVHNANRNQDIMGLNKLFLLRIKERIGTRRAGDDADRNGADRIGADRIDADRNGADRNDADRNGADRIGALKSQYTGEMERQMKEKKEEMDELLHPKAPVAIDFTAQKPYNPALRASDDGDGAAATADTTTKTTTTTRVDSVDETTINAALENKIKAREMELSAYYADRPPSNAANEKSKTLSQLEDTVSNNVDRRFEADAPAARRLTIQHAVPNDALSDTLTLIKNKERKDARVVHFQHDGDGKARGESDEMQSRIVARLDAVIRNQERTNELLQSEIDMLHQLVNKID